MASELLYRKDDPNSAVSQAFLASHKANPESVSGGLDDQHFDYFLALRDQSEPVGCICLRQTSAEIGEISLLLVAPDYRYTFVPDILVDQIETSARERRLSQVVVTIGEGQSFARFVYERNGFKFEPDPKRPTAGRMARMLGKARQVAATAEKADEPPILR